ncbi:response regulator [Asticcacaulis sp. SL142]|uniref:response regulator n=1 Tax=Asticcacaulis sp. SL142 TaxID=2995155 RepID=UPI00226CC01B|nr:response regulator [Asticcacaulis sp. SL142]WAC49278.1 response regulator [Asticcacaulis sp. SL142]
MPNTIKFSLSDRAARADLGILLSLIVVGLFFVITGAISYNNIHTLNRDTRQVTQTHDVLLALSEVMSSMKDAETGQRGYIITGDSAYLTPYSTGLNGVQAQLSNLDRLMTDTTNQRQRLSILRGLVAAKTDELARTLDIRRTRGMAAAQEEVNRHLGKNHMDAIRLHVQEMQSFERQRRTERLNEMERAYRATVVSVVTAAILGLILTIIVGVIVRRSTMERRRQEWLQSAQVGLSEAMLGELRLDQLGKNILGFLAEFTGAHAAAFYAKDGGIFKQVATFGVPPENDLPLTFGPGDGLPGQAVLKAGAIVIENMPGSDSLTVGTSLGQWRPRHLALVGVDSDGQVDGVIELGFINPMPAAIDALLERAAESVSVAIKSANYRASLQNLLEETQRQSEELQTQSEELRVNNEELEEQSRALRESQLRLEQQQAELEQTNVQLSEQARLLEVQRDDLSRSQSEIALKAQELEQASRYKSDFLANMSHELRTPLNSSLILAKLLGDNSEGNLTDEQIKFARTIQSSGNDLLLLINDILDLSKIEAGQMDIRPETVSIKRLVSDMTRTFDPVAGDKGLKFSTFVEPGVAEMIETDRLRLEQILKNLLSNAFKFTESGEVRLRVQTAANGKVAFSVTDTGIGISEDHQATVFDAFRQADGTISRKYGGTGLGLSISRELARLLGGVITLKSAYGQGSTFAVTIPVIYDPAGIAVRDALPMSVTPDMATPQVSVSGTANSGTAKPRAKKALAGRTAMDDTLLTASAAQDDRDKLEPDSRTIMVVEDDEAFARILFDMAHELGFKCLVAHTAEDALSVARQYLPQAVVLDVGLPDHSGLSVLDRLKRDPRTRHIPVHVVSAEDYTHAALSLGAIGYMLKPVKREELVEAFIMLESRLASGMRRILIVEDDDVQRDSVARLLQTTDVETVAVGTAAECLEKLKEETFDCMVLDLSLPDQSGYSLLETLSQEDAYAFPPVIVYTGRDLSSDDEQKLRRYSKSIIIKGAKSPERLLDEVTLFLHKVVSELSPEQQKMIKKAKNRDAMLEGRRILVVEDDVRNVYAVTNIFEPLGAIVQIARNGREALEALTEAQGSPKTAVDLVLMDVMMPEMDGLTATREIRKNPDWSKLPVIMLTAKAMKDDQERCIDAGANDYMAKPLDVEKLVSLVRVWMPR